MWLSMSKSFRNSDHKEISSMISSRRHIKEKRLDRLTLNELTFRLRRRTSFCSVIVIYTSLWYFRSRHNKAGCIKMTRLYQSHLTNIHKGAVSSSNNHTHCNKSLKKIQSPQTISNKCPKTTRCRQHFQPRSFTKTAPTSGFTQSIWRIAVVKIMVSRRVTKIKTTSRETIVTVEECRPGMTVSRISMWNRLS